MPTTIFVPAQPYPKQANDNIRSSDWNAAIDEVSRLSGTTQNLNQNTFTGPLTISGALTASGGLTVTGDETVSGTLTVDGVLGVGSRTRISQQISGNWAIFGANMYSTGSAWRLVNAAQQGANLHISAEGGTTQFRFGLMDAGATSQRNIAEIGTAGLWVEGALRANGGITGPITVNGALTVSGLLTASGGIKGPPTANGDLTITNSAIVSGSFLSVEGQAVVATSLSGQQWASFGSNAYYRGIQWNLLKTNEAGVCLRMSAVGGGNSEFRFARMEANSTTATDLATIGRDGLTVTGGINGPITVKGSLTVTGAVTASAALTVSGALTASGGINGPITVNGALKVGSTGGMLEVGSLTIISQNTAGSWSGFGKNFYIAENGSWLLKDTSKPGVNFHMSADGANGQEFRFTLREAGSTTNVLLASIGTGGLTVRDGINGPLTIRDSVTLTGSFLSMEGLAVISTNVGSGRWANFGSNLYYRGNQWSLATTAQPGVSLIMSGTQGGNREFCFVRVEANSTSSPRDLVTIGSQGIIVYNNKKVATGHEFLYMIRGTVNSNGAIHAGTGFSVTRPGGAGVYQINFNPAFSSAPTAVATQFAVSESASTLDNALIMEAVASSIRIKVGSSNGSAQDRAFTFIAMGPRN